MPQQPPRQGENRRPSRRSCTFTPNRLHIARAACPLDLATLLCVPYPDRLGASPMAAESQEVVRLRRENGLFRRLLDLGRQDEPEPFLREALGLIVDVTEAQQGYLELHDDQYPDLPSWSLAHGFTSEQVEDVRAAISHGIIAEAVATGKTIVTQSALLDERFSRR